VDDILGTHTPDNHKVDFGTILTLKLDRSDSRKVTTTGARDVRRFTIAALTGTCAAAVPCLWTLLVLWNGAPNLLRTDRPDGYAGNFYDLQARSILEGHLYLPPGSIGSEAFLHNGHQYTYFGIFPSLLRIPILLVTHSLDGRLTTFMILAAWILTAVFTSLLLWRARIVIRGSAPLGRTEAVLVTIFVASVLAGSVLVSLASTPNVFSEDIAWGVALAIAAIFALLGVLENPSLSRIMVSGGFVLAASLNRATTGYACVLAAAFVAVWFCTGAAGREQRHWWRPLALVVVSTLALSSAVTYAKFGLLFGFRPSDQVVFRAAGLQAIHGGNYFGLDFVPTNFLAYFATSDLHFGPVFPFVTLIFHPVNSIGGEKLFAEDRVAPVPLSTPLLFLLSCAGLAAVFRPKAARRIRVIAPLLIGAAAAPGAILAFGWIALRFEADFLPFVALAGAVGAIDLARRLERLRRRPLLVIVGTAIALALFAVVVNTGIAATPTASWSESQAANFVTFEKSISDLTGHPLNRRVIQANSLLIRSNGVIPADTLLIVGHCRGGLFAANGRSEWIPVESSTSVDHVIDVRVDDAHPSTSQVFSLIEVGTKPVAVVSLKLDSQGLMRFGVNINNFGEISPVRVNRGHTYRLTVITGPLNGSPVFASVEILVGDELVFQSAVPGSFPFTVHTVRSHQPNSSIRLLDRSPYPSDLSLCKSLDAQ
jgi:hypothetical protein